MKSEFKNSFKYTFFKHYMIIVVINLSLVFFSNRMFSYSYQSIHLSMNV